MIVIDASALMEVLLATGVGARVRARLFREEETLHAPLLLDLEIVHVLRRYCLIGDLQPNRAVEALCGTCPWYAALMSCPSRPGVGMSADAARTSACATSFTRESDVRELVSVGHS